MFTSAGGSPRLFLAECGASRGFGLSSQLDPVVWGLGKIQAGDSRLNFSSSCGGDSKAYGDQLVKEAFIILDLVQDEYSPFQLQDFLGQAETAVTSGW